MRGFTLLEVMLSIAAIAILTGISIPVFNSLQIQSDLDIATLSITENLRRAEILSQSVEGDSEWGVKIQSGSLTLFKGSSYAGRDSSYDEDTPISGAITPSGDTEIVFNKLTGNLGSSKSLTLQSLNNISKTVTLNTKGTINY